MKIIIGSDHGGFRLKGRIIRFLVHKKIRYEDLGAYSEKPVDYPDYAFKVAKKVAKGRDSRGILICGTGTGMAIAANKVRGIRASVAYDAYSAKMSRKDNDANVLALRGRKFSAKKAERIVDIWLKTPFSGKARHKRRIRKLGRIRG